MAQLQFLHKNRKRNNNKKIGSNCTKLKISYYFLLLFLHKKSGGKKSQRSIVSNMPNKHIQKKK